MNANELKKILDLHIKWWNGEMGGIRADLSDANLRRANLSDANLSGANLSGVKNFFSGVAWLLSVFKKTDKGIIVYKAQNAVYESPKNWEWKSGKYLTGICNPLPTIDCGCGVNFATREWIKKNHSDSPVWECLIEWVDLVETVIPYNTNGKARCSRLKLIKLCK